MITLYELLDPDNFEPRYVGQTEQALIKRFKQHIRSSSKSKYHSGLWIKSLKKQGLEPILREFYITGCPDEADSIEISLIAYYKSLGYNLTNIHEGGQRCRIVSDETREKCREAQKGNKNASNNQMSKRTTCPLGHDLGEMLNYPSGRRRRCLVCKRQKNKEWMREYYKRRRQKAEVEKEEYVSKD